MHAPLLVTKYQLPPMATDHVERARLCRRLDALLAPGKRVALVSAPAGSGKTTFVRAWSGKSKDEGGRTLAPALRSGASAGVKDEEKLLPSPPTPLPEGEGREAPFSQFWEKGGGMRGFLHPCSSAWLALDEEDNDPATYVSYLVAAFREARPELKLGLADGERQAADPTVPGAPSRARVADLVNGLAELPGLTVLVLDDYHVLSAPAVHECTAFLIDHLPERVRLVIVTRADALLPISRLRARGQLVELREADLRFTPEEAAAFFNDCMGLRLGLAEVEALAARTEGWAAGLQMAALALRGLTGDPAQAAAFIAGFSGSHRFVLDYLMDEVFSRLPTELQSFLLQTSILDRLCAPLCAAVVEDAEGRQSQVVLDTLERANLFLIPLDERRSWYRYHHLFADLLRGRLLQTGGTEAVAGLQRRASAWLAGQGLLEEAIHYALPAGDFERAAGWIEVLAQATISEGRQATLERWLGALPAETLRGRPRLRIYQAWDCYIQGDSAAAMRILEETAQALDALPVGDETARLRRELLSILAMSSLDGDDPRQAVDRAQAALADIPENEIIPRARVLFALAMAYGMLSDRRYFDAIAQALDLALQAGNLLLAASILSNQAFGLANFGLRLRDGWAIYQRVVDLRATGSDQGGQVPAGLGLVGQAAIALERDDLDLAERLLTQGMALCRQGGITLPAFHAWLVQARLAQARGNPQAAAAVLAEAAQLGSPINQHINNALLIQTQVRLRLMNGEIEGAARWACAAELPRPARLPANLQEIWDLSLAAVREAQGRPEEALVLIAPVISQAEAVGRMARVLEGSLVQALALHALGRDALAPLARALALSQPEGATRLYLESSPRLGALLAVYRSRLGGLAGEAERLLSRMGLRNELAQPAPAPSEALIEPLTPRELEVLRWLYVGKSNQEIAGLLYLSLSAIKKYTGSIYAKLGVERRAQAIARAREMHLV